MPTSRAPSKASGLSDAPHQDAQRRSDRSRRRPAVGNGSALQGSDREARARAIVRGHGEGNPPPDRSDERQRAAHVSRREPLPQYGEVRERQARGIHEKTDKEIIGLV